MQPNWERLDPASIADHDPEYFTAIRQRRYFPWTNPAPPYPKKHIAV
jgi:hypothetical protein